jgi:tetratricopeptide (TPR) repeat protein
MRTLPISLPAGRSAFSAQALLEKLGSIAQALSISMENPAFIVLVSQFEPKTDPFANRLTEQVRHAVQSNPGLTLAENNKTWDYRVAGSLASIGTEVRASIHLYSGHEDHPSDVWPLTDKSRRELERKVVRQVLTTLNDRRLADRFSVPTLAVLAPEELIKRGKVLLCQEQPESCRQDASAAERVFTVAKTKNANWEASYYLSLAQSAEYKYSEAMASMEEALQLVSSLTSEGGSQEKARIQVLNALGNLQSTRGDSAASVVQYTASLKLNPHQPEIFIKKAEALFTNSHVEGMQTLLDGVHENPADGQLASAVLENVRKLQDQDFANVEPRFKTAFAAGVPVRNAYALLWTRWGETNQAYNDPPQQKKYLDNARLLNPTDTDVVAETFGLAAAIDLPGNLDEADKNLKEAEKLPNDKIGSATLGWLARLRAIYFLDRKEYSSAVERADHARALDGTYDSDLIAANAANGWALDLLEKNTHDQQVPTLFKKAHDLVLPLAEYRFQGSDSTLHTANHGLNLDRESMAFFEGVLKDNPNDFSARLSLAFVCNEYLFDTECSFKQNQALLSHLDGLSASDQAAMQVNAIESAVLDRKYEQASVLFRKVNLAQTDRSLQVVADFYRLWLALVRKKPEEATIDFDHLRKSMPEYAKSMQQPDSQSSKWSFLGAQHALEASSLPAPKRKLLSDLIEVLNDPNKDIGSVSLPSDI